MMGRPSNLQVLVDMLSSLRRRSTCLRAQTAAITYTPSGQLLTTGYNGSPSGLAHCIDEGCILINDHCVRANHAEANALMQAAKLGIPVSGAFMVCTHRPCVYCAKLIIQAGIARVIYLQEYDTDEAHREVNLMMMGARVGMFKWRGE